MPLGIDATLRYGLNIPPTESIRPVAARQRLPVQHAQAGRPAADADREPRPRLDAGRRAPREGRLPLLRPQAGQEAPLLHGQLRRRSRTTTAAHGYGAVITGRTRLVGLLGDPRRAVAVAADAERGLRRARASTGRTCRCASGRTSSRTRCAGSRARVRRRERDDPAQAGGGRVSSRPTAQSVNTLVVRDGRGSWARPRTPRSSRSSGPSGRVIVGGGGAAAAFAGGAARDAPSSRGGDVAARRARRGPRRQRDVRAGRGARRAPAGPDARRPALSGDRDAHGRPAPRRRVVDGLEVLVAQGAASFEPGRACPRPSTSCAPPPHSTLRA